MIREKVVFVIREKVEQMADEQMAANQLVSSPMVGDSSWCPLAETTYCRSTLKQMQFVKL